MISMEEGVMFADNKTIDFKGVNNAEVNIWISPFPIYQSSAVTDTLKLCSKFCSKNYAAKQLSKLS